MKVYSFCKAVLGVIIRASFRLNIVGLENEPESGALLVCGNHISQWDPVVIGASLKKRQVRYMAKEEIFKIPIFGFLVKSLGAFPVKRGGNDIRAIKTTIGHLKDGECVGIFPQGTRYKGVDPRTTEVKGGAGMCAYHGKCDVLPVAIVNKKRRMLFMNKTYVVVGKVIKYEELMLTDGDKQQFERASRIIFDRICELSDEYYEKL